MNSDQRRFEELDSLRGLCACAVALFHFHGPGLLAASTIVRGSWLFVDFFFVLSGFVIAHAYRARLASGFSVARFMGLRFGRIYPLHLFMLLVYLAAVLVAGTGVEPDRTPGQFVQNVLLLNSLHAATNSWNAPSWSIAAEFWAYLAFAAIVVLLRGRAAIGFAALATIGLAVLVIWSREGLGTTFEFGLFRCFYGFGIGALAHAMDPRWRWSGTFAEIAVAVLTVILVAAPDGAIKYAAPLLFAVVVLVFARASGLISRALRMRPMLLLGTLSYSIYMVHSFVQGRLHDLLELLEPRLGLELTRHDPVYGDLLTVSRGTSDVLSVLMLALVIAAAAFTYRFVEQPGRRWTRKWLQARPAAPVPA